VAVDASHRGHSILQYRIGELGRIVVVASSTNEDLAPKGWLKALRIEDLAPKGWLQALRIDDLTRKGWLQALRIDDLTRKGWLEALRIDDVAGAAARR
jgi:hypothetical protein